MKNYYRELRPVIRVTKIREGYDRRILARLLWELRGNQYSYLLAQILIRTDPFELDFKKVIKREMDIEATGKHNSFFTRIKARVAEFV